MIRRHRRSGWGLALTGLLASAVQAEPVLTLDARGLSATESTASHAILGQALGRLTPKWRQALPPGIQVQWRDDLPAHVRGRAYSKRILLDRRLLHDWIAQARPPGSGEPASREVIAAVIHELAHVLDRSSQGGLSRDPRLLDLAGWQVRPLRSGRSDNAFRDRSPDRYELHSPAEFVAVNLEHYLLDPDYRCRRPALHAWFDTRLGAPQRAASACATALPYLQADSKEGEVSLLTLDPARVYAVDYLLAEGNAQAMSRWGHSMLRLVICAPGRAPGPDCRMDLQYHRVLSFRAYVGDVQISSWRGLTGSYPSRLFVLPLEQVVDEYTKVELRGLSSVPLRLRPDEIAGLLERAARVHWSYDGRYYFVSNNCAVETYKLLHDGVPRLAALPLSGITPRGLVRRLARAEMADTQVLADRREATRRGYYFESAATHYQAMFDVVRQRLAVPSQTVEHWLDAPPQARRPWMEQADLRASAALLLLEQAAFRRHELLARDAIKRRLLRGRDEGSALQRQSLQGLLGEAGILARPAAALAASGYGIPQAVELEGLSRQVGERSQALRDGWKALQQQARAQLPPSQRAALEGTEQNLVFIGQRLRELGAGQAALARP